jgi:superfamily II DNA or RNA helicase
LTTAGTLRHGDPQLDMLFLALPVSWRGTGAQNVGRLHRLHEQTRGARLCLVRSERADAVSLLRVGVSAPKGNVAAKGDEATQRQEKGI